jgi:hypothetical protein
MTPSCAACGRPLRLGAQFCTTCGASVPQRAETAIGPVQVPGPAPQPALGPTTGPPSGPQPPARAGRRPLPVLLIALAVLVVMAMAGGVAYLLRTRTVSDTAAPQPGPVPSAAPSGTQLPRRGLDALVAADRAAAESLVGRWVPQLSSKQVGTVDGGVTYDEAAILTEVEALKARFAHAVVIRSDDFTSFRRPGFWVTVVAAPSPSADGANSWCVDNGLARDQCFAKRLSHADGPEGSTVPR